MSQPDYPRESSEAPANVWEARKLAEAMDESSKAGTNGCSSMGEEPKASDSSGKPDDMEQNRKDQSVKLFVGQVPRTMSEEDLKPHFDEFGEITDVVIIRDKMSHAHKGCAFVTFKEKDAADAAVSALHNKKYLSPNKNPLQVRPATHQKVAEHKLFIGMLPKSADESQIRQIFSPFGTIEDVYILRHPASGQSKGCAFLKYADKQSALAAIEHLHNKHQMEGGNNPLVVKFADNQRHRLQRQRHAAAASYYRYPQGGNYQYMQLQQMQQQYMQQMQAYGAQGGTSPGSGEGNSPFMYYNPYMYGYGYPASVPGYGYGSPGDGSAASLSSQGGGLPSAAVASHGLGGVAASGAGGAAGGGGQESAAGRTAETSGAAAGAAVGMAGMPGTASAPKMIPNARPVLEGPQGANLFIYHLPHDLTDADLATAFAPFGTVISAKVYMDKTTGESKGFGFVSYDSVQAAEAAITSMNGFQIGSKRLKVQHKRIHHHHPHSHSHSGSPSSASSSPQNGMDRGSGESRSSSIGTDSNVSDLGNNQMGSMSGSDGHKVGGSNGNNERRTPVRSENSTDIGQAFEQSVQNLTLQD